MIWYGVYRVYEQTGLYRFATFDRDADAREYIDFMREKYPGQKFALLKWTGTDYEEVECL